MLSQFREALQAKRHCREAKSLCKWNTNYATMKRFIFGVNYLFKKMLFGALGKGENDTLWSDTYASNFSIVCPPPPYKEPSSDGSGALRVRYLSHFTGLGERLLRWSWDFQRVKGTGVGQQTFKLCWCTEWDNFCFLGHLNYCARGLSIV